MAIACLRSQGLAARYVSGYLETLAPPGKEKLVGTDASHAWFGVYVPYQGWVDFDPTNDQIPADRHITAAWGRDYADVAPEGRVAVPTTGSPWRSTSSGFEPGTKESEIVFRDQVGDGGGMGLAVVQGIVKAYGRRILVHTEMGCGSRFETLLPVTAQTSQQQQGFAETGNGLELRGKKLLVVEDEPIVRRYLKELLRGAGAEVIACADAAQALEAFRPSPQAFSLIITDHTMPGMSGAEMLRQVRALNEAVPVLMFSGYADVVSEEERIGLHIAEVLLKPLMGDELEAAIQRALVAH